MNNFPPQTTSPSPLLTWLIALRIPPPLASQYTLSLSTLGYDDIQSICEDGTLPDFLEANMKRGHAKRLVTAANKARDHIVNNHPPTRTISPFIPVIPSPHRPTSTRCSTTFSSTDGESVCCPHCAREFTVTPSIGTPDIIPETMPDSIEGASPLSADPITWSPVHVAGYLSAHEAFSTPALTARIHDHAITGHALLTMPVLTLKSLLGISFNPHVVLLTRLIDALRPPTSSPSPPNRSPASRNSFTKVAAAASLNRKLSPPPLQFGDDDLSVASGLSDSGDYRKPAKPTKSAHFSRAAKSSGFQPPPTLTLPTTPLTLATSDVPGHDNDYEEYATRQATLVNSYEFSDGGTLEIGNFKIGSQGIKDITTMNPITEESTPVPTPTTIMHTRGRSGSTGAPFVAPPTTSSTATTVATGITPLKQRIISPPWSPRNTRGEVIVLKEVGRGACGIVHEALHVPTLKLVAVKSVAVNDGEKRKQMIKELRAMHGICKGSLTQQCESTEIVEFYDAYTDPEMGCVRMVLEYMNAGTLQDLVTAQITVPERMLASVAGSVVQGLRVIHDACQIHRDIKPSNILLDRDGRIKISDFGIARKLEHSISMASTFTGTLTYMSPERISGQEYSYPSDVWSLGVCLATLAMGKYPYPTQSGYWGVVQAIQEEPCPTIIDVEGKGYGAELQSFVECCLVKDPKKRAGVEELLAHPFLNMYKEVKLAQEAPPEMNGKKLQALKSLAKTVMDYYVEKALDASVNTRGGVVDCLGGFLKGDVARGGRLTELSKQLGMPVEVVEEVFEKEAEKARVSLGVGAVGSVKESALKPVKLKGGGKRMVRSGSFGSSVGGSPVEESDRGGGGTGAGRGRYTKMALSGATG